MRRLRRGWKRAGATLPLALALTTTAFALSSTGVPVVSGDALATAADLAGVAASDNRADSRVRLRFKHHVKVGQPVRLHGAVEPEGGRSIAVRSGGRVVKRGHTDAEGKFALRWQPRRPGIYKVVVVAGGTSTSTPVRRRAEGRLNVYRPAAASYYGPGLYGNAMACGGTLTTSTLGVAHKTLPCGTKLRLRYGKRTVKVKVVDRGPFAGDREFDLTGATKERLRFGSTGVVLSTR